MTTCASWPFHCRRQPLREGPYALCRLIGGLRPYATDWPDGLGQGPGVGGPAQGAVGGRAHEEGVAFLGACGHRCFEAYAKDAILSASVVLKVWRKAQGLTFFHHRAQTL